MNTHLTLAPRRVVRMAYTLTDAQGRVQECVALGDAPELLLGTQAMPQALEDRLYGLRTGNVRRIHLLPGDLPEPFHDQPCTFDALILAVRDATPEELDAGVPLPVEPREPWRVRFQIDEGLHA